MDLGSDLLNEDKIAITDCPLAPEEIASVESVESVVGRTFAMRKRTTVCDILAGDVDQV